jgi:flagellar biosynthesis protein FlhA
METAVQRGKNNALALILISVMAVMLVPLPQVAIDLLISLNITLSLVIVLTVLNTPRPIDFSTFPSLLLFTALFRLALNVATTRLILLEGDAGHIITAFGRFVVGGNYIVGIIVFLILVVIQFIVITKGQNRISEVAARFTLDAMPGKQMSIDADLNAGLITNEEAKTRRRELQREAEFHGAMDGAGKFVRGDAIAGLIITMINLVGGTLIGWLQLQLAPGAAFEKFAILTIGDGLVSQIPGLVISVAAGLLTTKSASEAGLGHEMESQMLGRPPVLRTVAGLLAVIAFLPGLPMLPFLLLAGGTLGLSRRRQSAAARPAPEKAAPAEGSPEAQQAAIEDLLTVDRLGIEIGYRLISLVEPGRGGGLLEHIRNVRRQFASTLGIVVPPIRVKDNVQIDPQSYQILLHGQVVARGELRPGCRLAMNPGGAAPDVPGVDTVEPAFGLPARWIAEGDTERAEVAGWTVIDAPSVLVTHLTEVLKKHCHELLSRDDTKSLVDNLKKHAPAAVEDLLPGQLSLGQLQRVLAGLLREQVPIRNLQTILEALADGVGETKDLRLLTERVRARLARTIVDPHLDSAGTLHAAVIEPALERSLADAVAGQEGIGALPQGFLARFVDSTAEALAAMARQGRDPVLVTRAALRPFLAEAIAGVIPNAAVLSYQETAPARKVETTARIAVPA